MIVDASVAVKWLVFDEGSERALDLLKGELAAPSIWLAEPANALRAKCARGEISEQEACDFALDLLDAPVAPIDLRELPSVAMRMALDLNHPIYDCLYLAGTFPKHYADHRGPAAGRQSRAHPYFAGRAVMLGE